MTPTCPAPLIGHLAVRPRCRPGPARCAPARRAGGPGTARGRTGSAARFPAASRSRGTHPRCRAGGCSPVLPGCAIQGERAPVVELDGHRALARADALAAGAAARAVGAAAAQAAVLRDGAAGAAARPAPPVPVVAGVAAAFAGPALFAAGFADVTRGHLAV